MMGNKVQPYQAGSVKSLKSIARSIYNYQVLQTLYLLELRCDDYLGP